MLAKSCLLEKSDDSMNNSMNSVIRLLDQTYQRLLCDENNKTNNNNDDVVANDNVKQTNNLSRSSSKDENLVTSLCKEQQPPKCNQSNNIEEFKHASKSQPANVTNMVNGTTTRSTSNLQNVTFNDDIGSSLQNEISSTSSSSILSSSLSSSRTSSKHVSNKKVEFIFDYKLF